MDHRSLRLGDPRAANARRPMAMLWAGKFEHGLQQASWRITNNKHSTDKGRSNLRGCGGWEHGPSVQGGWQAVPTTADIKLRKDWTTAVADRVPLNRRAVYNLDKRMRPIKLRWLVVRQLGEVSCPGPLNGKQQCRRRECS